MTCTFFCTVLGAGMFFLFRILLLSVCINNLMCLCHIKLFSFWKATSIPNFSYMGARLCNYLSHHLTISPQSGNFRQLLLQRLVCIYEIKGKLLLNVLEFDHSSLLKTVLYRKLQGRIGQTILFFFFFFKLINLFFLAASGLSCGTQAPGHMDSSWGSWAQ